jgi:hypothetical protein
MALILYRIDTPIKIVDLLNLFGIYTSENITSFDFQSPSLAGNVNRAVFQ